MLLFWKSDTLIARENGRFVPCNHLCSNEEKWDASGKPGRSYIYALVASK
jgi:hypothetical protein